MTDTQLYLAIGVPIVSNAILLMIFSGMVSTRLSAFETAIHKRFDDMREIWRSELRRVGEVLDARLKHLEETRQ